MTSHRIVGLSEVARLTGKSLSTVNRNVKKLRDFGAEKDSEGIWHVPVTAIEGVGWSLQSETSDMPRHVTPDMRMTRSDMSEMQRLKDANSDLRQRLIRAEAEAEKWQMVAAERLQNLDDLRRSQRLLESGGTSSERESESRSGVTSAVPSAEEKLSSERTMQDQAVRLFARFRGRKAR